MTQPTSTSAETFDVTDFDGDNVRITTDSTGTVISTKGTVGFRVRVALSTDQTAELIAYLTASLKEQAACQ